MLPFRAGNCKDLCFSQQEAQRYESMVEGKTRACSQPQPEPDKQVPEEVQTQEEEVEIQEEKMIAAVSTHLTIHAYTLYSRIGTDFSCV